MANLNCTFYIPADGQPGKLTGGFQNGTSLSSPGSLTVNVVHPDAETAPSTLTGVFVFTTSPLALTNQTAPSPFVMGPNSNFACLSTQQAIGSISNGGMLYTFGSIAYGGGQPGSYELTFVAVNNEVSPPLQWAEDPEFDTSN
jgi:hypothetical protein